MAITQKLRALLDRKETQSRDVFDLDLLLGQVKSHQLELPSVREEISEIEEKIFSLDFELFHSQVVAYLEPRYQEHYSQRTVWEELQLRLVEKLRSL